MTCRKIACIVLAAGQSRRLNAAKALLTVHGKTLLHRTLDAAHGCNPTLVQIVVGGLHAARIQNEARAWRSTSKVGICLNSAPEKGMSRSLRVGLAMARRTVPGLERALVLVCDQPLLTADVLQQLLDALDHGQSAIAACAYDHVVGVPAAFRDSAFGQLAALRGDHGARDLLRRDSSHVVRVPWPDGRFDVDTIDDLHRLNIQLRGSS